MTIRGIAGLQRAARWAREKMTPRAVILMYHRVVDLSSDPYALSVSPQHFAEHMEVLKKQYHPLRLEDLPRTLRGGRLPRRAVLVTFDDGYDDILHNAKPLLERFEIPATLFVVTGHVGANREFWWDELDRLLLEPGRLPESLRLKINGEAREWELDGAARYTRDDYSRYSSWNYEEKTDPTARHSLFRSLWQQLRTLPEQERWRVLGELQQKAGAEPDARPTHRILSPDEVSRLAEDGLVEIGAHTVTHPVLSSLSGSDQLYQIRQSRADLEEILNRPVTSFSYPHGSRLDYTKETASIVRASGFDCACAAFAGLVRQTTDCYELPRVPAIDIGGEAFSAWLGKWFRD